MFDRYGVYGRRNDPCSDLVRGFFNALLRSRFATLVLLSLTLFVACPLVWNFAVDQYVLQHGERVDVPVVNESKCRKSGYEVTYLYPNAERGNPWHLLNGLFHNGSRPAGHGVATTWRSPRHCSTPAESKVTVAYLRDAPRVHVVVNDRDAQGQSMVVAGFLLLAGVALAANYMRLEAGRPPAQLPGWPT